MPASDIETRTLTPADLAEALREVDPNAVLTPPRILRRVIKHDRQFLGLGLHVPHRKSYVISRRDLQEIVAPGELSIPEQGEDGETLLLLQAPNPKKMLRVGAEQTLVWYWRLLFHSRIDAAVKSLIDSQQLTISGIRQRIHQVGQTSFDEVRSVLEYEERLLPPRDAGTVWMEFCALFLEIRYFAPRMLSEYFPSVDDFDRIFEILHRDIAADEIFASTRLPGAPSPTNDPHPQALQSNQELLSGKSEEVLAEQIEQIAQAPPVSKEVDERNSLKFQQTMEKAASLGNQVRAAILCIERASEVDAVRGARLREEAVHHIETLVDRLQEALDFTKSRAAEWKELLPHLLRRAAKRFWTPEARLLYDLQKVCFDHECQIYRIDLIGCIRSLGKHPLKQPLPSQGVVRTLLHLKTAYRRLPAIRVDAVSHERFVSLFHEVMHHSEEEVRDRFRPIIRRAFERSGPAPKDVIESTAIARVIEQLLDRITSRGYLTISELRDELSRSQYKMDDIATPHEFLTGDRLLRLDRELAAVLQGVYRRGEFYLRLLHRFSSVNFGTLIGRLLVLNLFLPFGGAFIILEGLQHLTIEPYGKITGHHLAIHLSRPPLVLLVGAILFGIIRSAEFREMSWRGLVWIGRILRTIFYVFPYWFIHLPLVHRLLESRLCRLGISYLLKPIVVVGGIWFIAYLFGFRPVRLELAFGLTVLAMSLLLNTRLGRHLEEVVIDFLVHWWHRIRIGIFVALFQFIIDMSRRFIEGVERVLYAVDERLRFRSGESQIMGIVKPILSIFWSMVTYVVRFLIILVVEPQVNPIKHFPVVTVAHKLMLPLIPSLAGVLAATMDRGAAYTIATSFIAAIPGVFGFLVWEFKENWRLYAANRPADLPTAVIGSHGETMLRYMKPGFHSGTLPKLYHKLRRSERKALWNKQTRASLRYREELEHVSENIGRFTERELVELLRRSKGWGDIPIQVESVRTGSNRIQIELTSHRFDAESAWIVFDEQSGILLAQVEQNGWLDQLDDRARRTFDLALAGFYQICGVRIVRGWLAAAFAPHILSYDIREEGLVVWEPPLYEAEAVYPLGDEDLLYPVVVSGHFKIFLPPLDRGEIFFDDDPLTWEEWQQAWHEDASGETLPRLYFFTR